MASAALHIRARQATDGGLGGRGARKIVLHPTDDVTGVRDSREPEGATGARIRASERSTTASSRQVPH